MPSSEHIRIFNAPVDETGGFSGAPSAENPQPLSKQALAKQISEIPRQGLVRHIFEQRVLEKTGLLSALETAGIVPSVPENLNPFDPDLEREQFMYWGKAQPQVVTEFRAGANQRKQVLDTIYLGAAIRQIVGGQLYFHTENPIRAWSSSQTNVEFFKQAYKRSPVHIDYKLSSVYGELLPALEEAGIVPATPRPPLTWFKWEQEQQKHWLKHNPDYAARASTLQHLYIGMLVNEALEEL